MLNIFPMNGIVTFYIWDFDQEIIFKSHSNTITFCNLGKMLPELHMACLILFHFTSLFHFCNEIERCLLRTSFKYFNILQPVKNDVRFEFVSWKKSDFVWFPLIWFTLVIKLSDFDFQSHWNTLICFDKKNNVRPEYVRTSCQTHTDLVQASFFWEELWK